MVTDVLASRCANALDEVLDLARWLSGDRQIRYDLAVARSELETGHRNAALAHFLKSFGNLENDAHRVMDIYCHHCSLAMSCTDLAKAGLFLANGGRTLDGEAVTSSKQAKYINSLLLTCGVYDAAGDFAYRVGTPRQERSGRRHPRCPCPGGSASPCGLRA